MTALASIPLRERLPDRRFCGGIGFRHDGYDYIGGAGYFTDGRLAEVWLRAKKTDSAVDANACDSAILASMLLQHGVAPETISHSLSKVGHGGGPLGRLLTLIGGEKWQ